MRQTYKFNFDATIDAQAGETHHRSVTIDGRAYEVVVTPQTTALRKMRIDAGDGIEKPAISLGPRQGGCACCGK